MDEEQNGPSRFFSGQTPKNLKQKFFSVLGTSSEYKKQFISGISNKVQPRNRQFHFGYIRFSHDFSSHNTQNR